MLRSDLATQPVALSAVGCGVTFLAGPLTVTRYRSAVFLALLAFQSLIFSEFE